MLNTKPINPDHLRFRYSGAAKHYEFNRETEKRSKEQTTLEDGTPVWKVRCVAVYPAVAEHGEITVTVAHPNEPTAEFDSPIHFTEMTVKDWHMNGNSGQTWHAETFTADAPTVKPSTARAKNTEQTAG